MNFKAKVKSKKAKVMNRHSTVWSPAFRRITAAQGFRMHLKAWTLNIMCLSVVTILLSISTVQAQIAVKGETIWTMAGENISNGVVLIGANGKIEAVGTAVSLPKDAVVVDCKGKYIYPSFIDIYSDYGTPASQPAQRNFLLLWLPSNG